MTTPPALHSSKTPKWGTPSDIIEISRQLLGYIHLDPASSEEFNFLVKALMIYTARENGLAPEYVWSGNVFLNPPGGLVKEFWRKLVSSVNSGEVQKAIWIGFSIEQLAIMADEEYHPLDYSTCILRHRLAFNREDLTPGKGPSHANYITGINTDPELFTKLFSDAKLFPDKNKIIHGGLTLSVKSLIL